MINFCTLFDSNYLTRGLALYTSLREHSSNFHLYILAFDDKALQILNSISLPSTTIISLKEFEDADLLVVKPSRSRAEYSWTCSSSIILYCLQHYKINACTYIDADIYFFSDPKVLVEEMGDKSILLTEHRYTPEYDRTKLSGHFCVQFLTFKANEEALKALQWWRERCLEWCFDRHENGKMGDQKYLDDWTSRFEGVYVLKNLGGGMAPWNIQQYVVTRRKPLAFEEKATKRIFPPVFYHFHQLKIYRDGRTDLGAYRLSSSTIEALYKPYLKALHRWDALLKGQPHEFHHASEFPPPKWDWRAPLRKLKRRLKGVYNIYSTQSLIE